MASGTNGTNYRGKEEVFFDDGREVELLHFVYGKENVDEIRGSPKRVLEAIDEFARTRKYLMNVGEAKGAIVVEEIKARKPEVMVEFGGYVAYSCILFGDAMRSAGGSRYWCLERSPEFAAVIMALVDLAGLSDTVKVVIGSSDASVRRLHSSGALQKIDMTFMDHYKPAYVTDLKLCEELKLISPGTVLAADNVIEPGNPPYLKYVRSTCEEKRRALSGDKVNGTTEHFPDRTTDQYKSRQGKETLNHSLTGDPDLIYESRLIHSFEPTGEPDGVEITRCVGVEGQ